MFGISIGNNLRTLIPPPRSVGREGRSEAEARVGASFCTPTPTLVSLASTLPTRGREKEQRGEVKQALRLGERADQAGGLLDVAVERLDRLVAGEAGCERGRLQGGR